VQLDAPVVTPPVFTGRIGFGTTQSAAEFKDITVTKDGQTLFQSDFSKGFADWQTRGGTWAVKDGVLQQTTETGEPCVFIGDPRWNNYTLSLKARKVSGRDGFIIHFAVKDGTELTWRIAVEGNSQDRLEIPGATDPYVPGHVEEGRWHDIRVELKGSTVKCYQDGQFIQEADCKPYPGIFASAGRATKTGEIIVAVTNPTAMPQTVRLNLAGVKSTKLTARATVLTGADPEHDNTFEAPDRVKPREESVTLSGPQFERSLPAWSFTVLRIKP
jgi:alpha-L-arabinofuranosidase